MLRNGSEIDIVARDLRRLGYSCISIRYPTNDSKRSVDLVVSDDSHTRVIVRITREISARRRDFIELKRISELLSINALIVADKYNKEELIDNVLYLRDRIGIITKKTLHAYSMGDKVLVYEYKGVYYVKINGEKLRELRTKKRIGASMLAKAIGISSRALHQYEQGAMNMRIEVAERLLEVLGPEFENVLENLDIMKFRIVSEKSSEIANPSSSSERCSDEVCKIVNKMNREGIRAASFSSMPSDVVAKYGDLKAFVSLIDSRIDDSDAQIKLRENYKLAKELGGLPLSLVLSRNRSEIVHEAEQFSEVVVSNPLDIVNVLKQETRR